MFGGPVYIHETGSVIINMIHIGILFHSNFRYLVQQLTALIINTKENMYANTSTLDIKYLPLFKIFLNDV